MLVISRKPHQGVWIGEVFVFVVQVRGDNVRLGIEAPKDTHVLREELLDEQEHMEKREVSRQYTSQFERESTD